MRKRVDHDATQEVSSSQLVPDAKPPAFTGANNDASMWLQAPVSADDFVGAAKKKPARRSGRGLVIGLFAVLLVAVTGAGVWYAILRPRTQPSTSASAHSAASSGPATSVAAPAQPAVAPAALDAGTAVAATPPDAAVDAGVGSAALKADAVSAADPVIKKKRAKKRTATKKKSTTKKSTKKKRSRRR